MAYRFKGIKPGPKPGSHWSKPTLRNGKKLPDGGDWPGPFVERTDFPSVRPAMWINCNARIVEKRIAQLKGKRSEE